jgi:biotin synthase-like enzyme
MVGNYLTTLNQPVEKDLQMLRDLGLNPDWDNDFTDQVTSSEGCGNRCGCDEKPAEVTA